MVSISTNGSYSPLCIMVIVDNDIKFIKKGPDNLGEVLLTRSTVKILVLIAIFSWLDSMHALPQVAMESILG